MKQGRKVHSFEQKNYIKQKLYTISYEQGRSMVEMLGTLAVIGVLSVAGITGYRYAMNKYRANDIVNEVNMRANDIWHRYQGKPLPEAGEEETDFPEFSAYTGTGYRIKVKSHPDVAFRIHVDNVESGVCKQILNMPLIEVIQGLEYVQVNNIKYEGDQEICGEDESGKEIVFTAFLDTDTQRGEHCLEDSECTSVCGVPACDAETMRCTDGCTNNEDGKTKCLNEGGNGRCVECIVNEDCAKKGQGMICQETSYTCEKMEKACEAGTFRTRNGACVSCDDGSNFFVYMNGEPYPDSSDTVDGYTMCQACDPERKYGESLEGEDIGYCSYMCTMGVSYQAKDGRCISCKDTGDNVITNETISKEQCLACPNHFWYAHYLGGPWCGIYKKCPEGQYRHYHWGNWNYPCYNCTSDRNSAPDFTWSTSSSYKNFVTDMYEMCNNCPDYVNGVWAKRRQIENKCYPVCEQPDNAEEQVAICQANPSDSNCKRKWQNANGACYACDVSTTESSVLLSSKVVPELKELCEACGRRVNGKGYCVPSGANACNPGTYMAADGTCHSCSENRGVSIESDELSGCTANCRQNENGEFVSNGSVDTRWVYNKTTCEPVCEENYFQAGSGTCYACDGTSNGDSTTIQVFRDSCNSCQNRQMYFYCEVKDCGQGKFHERFGGCMSCSSSNSGVILHDDRNGFSPAIVQQHINECLTCGNRMYIPNGWNHACVLVNPGVSGICNSVGNNIPDELNDDLLQAAQPYLDGDYDGQFARGRDGYCYPCENDSTFTSYQEQCNSCKNRRYENGNCLKGLCEEGRQFLNAGGTCVSCTNKNVAVTPTKANLCSSCANRRQLETGSSALGNWAAKCVESCAGEQWQDINGNCLLCNEGGNRDIGTDLESRQLCSQCENRQVVEKKDADDNIIGYSCAISV